ncbi:unnamed protein product [Closterium sp. Naga37s-1]|nr:unnamed protein product [Closterium sp. Naga37s-1]
MQPAGNKGRRGQKTWSFAAHSSSVNCISIGRKSAERFITGGDDKKLHLWSTRQRAPLLSLRGNTSAIQSVLLDASEELAVAGGAAGAVKLWDLVEGRAIRTMTGHKAAPVALDLYSAGGLCASLSPADGTARVWDPRQKEAAHVFRGMGAGDAGEGGGAVGGGGAEGRGAGAGGGAESAGGKGGKTVGCVRFSPDGRWVVAGGQDGRIKLFDLAQGRLFAQLAGHAGAVAALDFHPQELLLASAARDRTVRWWDLESFNCVDCSPAGAGGTAALAFAPQGDALFAPCVDHLKVSAPRSKARFQKSTTLYPVSLLGSVLPLPWRLDNPLAFHPAAPPAAAARIQVWGWEPISPNIYTSSSPSTSPLLTHLSSPVPTSQSSTAHLPLIPLSLPLPLLPLSLPLLLPPQSPGQSEPATLPSSRARSSSLPRSLARHLAPTIASLQRARRAPSPSPSPSACCDGERERERAREREREKEWDDRVSVGTPRRYVRSPQRSNGGVGRGERGERGSAVRCSSEGGWWGGREGKGGRGGVVAAVVLGRDDCNGGGDKGGNYGGYTTGGDTSTDDECTSHRLSRGGSASHGATTTATAAAAAATAAHGHTTSRRGSHVHSLASPRRSPPSSSPSNPTGHFSAPAASARAAPSSSATPVTVTPGARVPSAAAHPASPAAGRANAAAATAPAPASAAATTPTPPAAATQAAAGRGGQGAVSGRSPIVDLVSRVSDWIGSLSSQEQSGAGEKRGGGSGGSERRKAERGGSEGKAGERGRGKVEEEVADAAAAAGAGAGGGATGSAGNGGGSSSFGRLGQTARRMTFGSGGNGGGNNGDGNTHAVAAAAAAASAATASRGSGSRPGSGTAVAPASAAAGRVIKNTPANTTTNANADANACTHTTSGDHPSIPPYAASLRAPYAADTQPDSSPPPTCSSASASLSVGSWGFRTSSKARGKRQGSPVPALSEGRSGSVPSQSSLVRKLGLFVPRLRPPYAVDDEEVEEGEEVEQGGGGEMAGMVRSQSEKVPGSGPLVVIRHGGLADVGVSANKKAADSGGVGRRVSGEEERRRGEEKGKEGAVGAAERRGGGTGTSTQVGFSRDGSDAGNGAATAAAAGGGSGGGVVGRVGAGSMGGVEERASVGVAQRQVGGGAGDLIPFLREAERQEQLQQAQQQQQRHHPQQHQQLQHHHHPQQQQQQQGGGQASEDEAAMVAAVKEGHEGVVRQLAARRQAVRQVGEMWSDGLVADALAFLAVTADEGVSGGRGLVGGGV